MDWGAWWATVHGAAKNWTRLSDFTHSTCLVGAKEIQTGVRTRRAREAVIHWGVPDLNSIQSWGGKLNVMQPTSRSGRVLTRVTWMPSYMLVWAKGSRHSLAAPLPERNTVHLCLWGPPPSHGYPLLKHHLISCHIYFLWGSKVLPSRSFAWLNSSYTDHFFLFLFSHSSV